MMLILLITLMSINMYAYLLYRRESWCHPARDVRHRGRVCLRRPQVGRAHPLRSQGEIRKVGVPSSNCSNVEREQEVQRRMQDEIDDVIERDKDVLWEDRKRSSFPKLRKRVLLQ